MREYGKIIKGELSSANASGAGVSVSLFEYTAAGWVAFTIGANQTLFITSMTVVCAVAMRAAMVEGGTSDAAGNRILQGSFAANSGITNAMMDVPHPCKRGAVPLLIASTTGQVDVVLRGFVQDS